MLKKFGLVVILFALAIGCAKERQYEEVYKSPKLTTLSGSSSPWDFGEEYLYLASTLDAPRFATLGFPFAVGNEVIVKMRKTERGIEFYQEDNNPTYNNEINQRPILTIPGNYYSFRCSEDSNGDCTNREEINGELEWDQKDKFLPEFEAITVHDVNQVDLFHAPESSGEAMHTSTKLVDYKFENGSITIELEKYYTLTQDSMELAKFFYKNDGSLTNSSFKIRYLFSFVPLSKLASNSYMPVEYPVRDHNLFGFFETVQRSSNLFSDTVEKRYLNRWDSAQKNIIYHLSDSFNDTNSLYAEIFKDSSYKAFEIVNKGLEKAGVDFRVSLVAPSGKRTGDLRYNMIQLINEPLASGVLGYGPTVTNPRTGQIVNAHVNMYGGGLTRMASDVWQQMVQLRKDEINQTVESVSVVESVSAENKSEASSESETKEASSVVKVMSDMFETSFAKRAKVRPMATLGVKLTKSRVIPQKLNRSRPGIQVIEKAQNQLELRRRIDSLKEKMSERSDHLQKLGTHNIDVYQGLNSLTMGKNFLVGALEIPGAQNPDGTLKRWFELSEEQKGKAFSVIGPQVWISTLVHELGHTLGLRHNFIGSADPENFYSKSEMIESYGVNQTPQYSSIMDYAYSSLNELSVFGKYDIAALRFAYKRQVELSPEVLEYINSAGPGDTIVQLLKSQYGLAEGKFVDLNQTAHITRNQLLTDMGSFSKVLKVYRFCTDEDKSDSLLCSPHDEGTNLLEVTQNNIKRYHDNYKMVNFRDGYDRIFYDNGSFTPVSTSGYSYYIYYIYDLFMKIQGTVAEHEIVKERFDGIDIEKCREGGGFYQQNEKGCSQLIDATDARKLAEQFFVSVLVTPKHTCAVVDANNEISYKSLEDIYTGLKKQVESGELVIPGIESYVPHSCFDAPIRYALSQNDLQVGAETGKFFNSLELINADPNGINESNRNQLAVRGTWVDKHLAIMAMMESMTYRNGKFQQFGSILDTPEVEGLLSSRKILEDYVGHLAFPWESELEVRVPFIDGSGKVIPEEVGLNYYFDYFDYKIPMQGEMWINYTFSLFRSETMLLESLLETVKYNRAVNDMRDIVVYKRGRDQLISNPDMLIVEDGDYQYGALSDNTIAHNIISKANLSKFLKETPEEILLKVKNLRDNPTTVPEKLSEEEQSIYLLGVTTLDFIAGVLKDRDAGMFGEETLATLDQTLVSIIKSNAMVEEGRISDELLLESVQKCLALTEENIKALSEKVSTTLPDGLSEIEIKVFNTVKQDDLTQFFGNPYYLDLMGFYQSLLTYLPYM